MYQLREFVGGEGKRRIEHDGVAQRSDNCAAGTTGHSDAASYAETGVELLSTDAAKIDSRHHATLAHGGDIRHALERAQKMGQLAG